MRYSRVRSGGSRLIATNHATKPVLELIRSSLTGIILFPAIGGTTHGLTPRGDAGGVYIDWLVGSNGPEEIVFTLSKPPYTMSDLLNAFSAAGLWIETTVEPQLSEDARRRYPHKQAWLDKYLGILIFVLRPLPDR